MPSSLRKMSKGYLKGIFSLAVPLLLLYYIGVLYRLSSFSLTTAITLFCAVFSVPPLLLGGYRMIGTAPAWLAIAGAFPLLYYGSRNTAFTVLVWCLCCGTPLAVSVFWPRLREIGSLTYHALPASGILWLGGTLVYCKLHFGVWDLAAATERISYRYLLMVEEMESAYKLMFGEPLPEPMPEGFEMMKTQSELMGFYVACMLIYALVGSWFLAVFLADRSLPADGRWLGSWKSLIPDRRVTVVFMTVYVLLVIFGSGRFAVNLKAVLDLFGFFYVFTSAYTLLQLMRKKKWPKIVCWGVVFLLLGLSYFTAGSVFISPYLLMVFAGFWIVASPRIEIRKEK